LNRIILAAGVLAATSTAAAGQPAPVPAPPAPVRTGLVATADGVSLHYELRGSGPDTLIALHGGPGLSSAYLASDLDLLARDQTLIFYDQRGAGRSSVLTDSTRLRVADHIRDLEAVRRHFGLERVTLLGHSWGAGLAALYARAHPDRTARLVLVDPIPLRATPWMQQFGRNLRAWMDSATAARFAEVAAARRDASDPVTACRAYWAVFIHGYFSDPRDPTLPARMRGDVCSDPPEAIRNSGLVGRSVLGPFGDWDWREDFRDLRMPVLVIHGDKDPIPPASAAEWPAAFPDASLVLIANAGHFPHVEQPDAFLRAVEDFLQREASR
jgi:proline iminopeptidase